MPPPQVRIGCFEAGHGNFEIGPSLFSGVMPIMMSRGFVSEQHQKTLGCGQDKAYPWREREGSCNYVGRGDILLYRL
jgi:hypothetical protein